MSERTDCSYDLYVNFSFFLSELFDGDHDKVKELNKRVCEKMGFSKWVPVSGQTYSRKIDFKVLSALSGLAQSSYKMCSDIRLLASMKEIGKEYILLLLNAFKYVSLV